jgi:hypothetical protein
VLLSGSLVVLYTNEDWTATAPDSTSILRKYSSRGEGGWETPYYDWMFVDATTKQARPVRGLERSVANNTLRLELDGQVRLQRLFTDAGRAELHRLRKTARPSRWLSPRRASSGSWVAWRAPSTPRKALAAQSQASDWQ